MSPSGKDAVVTPVAKGGSRAVIVDAQRSLSTACLLFPRVTKWEIRSPVTKA